MPRLYFCTTLRCYADTAQTENRFEPCVAPANFNKTSHVVYFMHRDFSFCLRDRSASTKDEKAVALVATRDDFAAPGTLLRCKTVVAMPLMCIGGCARRILPLQWFYNAVSTKISRGRSGYYVHTVLCLVKKLIGNGGTAPTSCPRTCWQPLVTCTLYLKKFHRTFNHFV